MEKVGINVSDINPDVSVVGTETPPAFEQFFRAEYSSIVAIASAVCGSFGGGEDVAQEAMVRASRNWQSVAALDRPGAWVRRVAINLALNRVRDVRRHHQVIELAHRAQQDTPTDHPEDDKLWRALAAVSPEQRTLLALVELDGYQPREVAEVLQCRPGAIRVRLHRARVALRAACEQIEENS